MSGLTLAASGETLDLSGANVSYVVVVAAIALVALGFAVALRNNVLAAGTGTEKMQSIAAAVQEGASAFLARQFRTLAGFAVLAVILLTLLPADDASIRVGRSVFFVVGASFSAFIAYAGMGLATRANLRVAAAAREANGAATAMQIAFRTGGVVGFLTVGLGLLGAATVVLIYKGDAPDGARGLRLRRRPAGHVHPGRRRHLHQGSRRRRRPGRQGGAEHPRGRPPQRRHHRGQRR